MFTRQPKEKTDLDRTIAMLVALMSEAEPDAAIRISEQIAKLYKAKEQETPKRVSPDTLILVAGNLLGIVLILNYEKANVLTSRAIGFVMKLR